jgi:hypothetical protein
MFDDYSVACYLPGMTGRRVHVGHLSESPGWQDDIIAWMNFQLPGYSDTDRRELLRRSNVDYVLFTQKRSADPMAANVLKQFMSNLPPYLEIVPEASNADAEVLRVRREAL